jgi:hypothetical protein
MVTSRRGNVLAERQDVNEVYVPKSIPKSEAARTLISIALKENILFSSLGPSEVAEMIDAMAPVEFPSGSEVIKQGISSAHLIFCVPGVCTAELMAATFVVHACMHCMMQQYFPSSGMVVYLGCR